MGFMDFIKKKVTGSDPDPLSDLTLAKLKKGYYLDYDMKTWQVTAANRYEWGEEDITWEWQLQCHDDTIYLEREYDDEDTWSISRKVPFGKLDPQVRETLIKSEEAPDTILFEGTTFYIEETGGAYFFSDGSENGRPVFVWDYLDDSESQILSIEQWGDNDYELAVGMLVEEYQFSDILPSKMNG